MPLVPFSQLMQAAAEGGYAVAYCEPWDEASLEAILRGAEQAHSPIMVGHSGIYLPSLLRDEIRYFAAWARAGRLAAEQAQVPVSYLFNECPRWEWAQAALDLGFNVVMYSNPQDDPGLHLLRTAELVQQAAAVGVEVESEAVSLMGELHSTDPAEAADFARQSGIHGLGVTAGNRHVATGTYHLDLELISRLAQIVPVPLVLHGGSGADDAQLQEAVRRGVRQVNYGTALRLAFLERLAESLAGDWRALDPHELLGSGLADDLACPGLEAVSALVEEKCRLLGSAGQA